MSEWVQAITLATEVAAAAGLMMAAGGAYALRRIRHHRAVAEDRLQMLNNLSEGVYRSTVEGRQISANRALVRLNGFSSEREMLETVNSTAHDAIARDWYVDPARRAEFKRVLHRDGVIEDFVSQIHRHKTRERIWISENARLVVCPKTGQPLFYEGTVRDITETIAKRQAEQRLNRLADIVPGGLFQMRMTSDGRFSMPFMSRPFRTLLGLSEDDEMVNPQAHVDRIHPQDKPGYLMALDHSARTLAPWRNSFRFAAGPARRYLWLEVNASVEREPDGAVVWSGMLSDVSEQKRMIGEIERLAYHDALTDLPNRRLLIDRVSEAQKIHRRRKRHAALLFIDLDGFKTINDTYGHEGGDRFIRLVADALSAGVRESDTVARFGGDEFVVLLQDLDTDPAKARADAVLVTEKLMRQLAAGVSFDGAVRPVHCSIGVALFRGRSSTPDQLIMAADRAMYRAKATGRNRCVIDEIDTVAEVAPLAPRRRKAAETVEAA